MNTYNIFLILTLGGATLYLLGLGALYAAKNWDILYGKRWQVTVIGGSVSISVGMALMLVGLLVGGRNFSLYIVLSLMGIMWRLYWLSVMKKSSWKKNPMQQGD